MTNLDTLSSFDSDNDPLQDLIRRVEQMENSTAGGYDAAIKFYKRIIARIELADEIALEGWSRLRSAASAANDSDEHLPTRLYQDAEYMNKRLKELGEDSD